MMRAACLYLLLLLCVGCRRGMFDQPKARPLRTSDFFENGAASRLPVEHTVARGQLNDDEQLFTGSADGKPAETFPFPISRDVLERGRERYDIHCAVCHGRTGRGDGMVVQRGFGAPASLHEPRLREMPPGRYFEVITDGVGKMYPFASRIEPADRWAIVAYIRALQLSQHAQLADVPADDRTKLESQP